MTTRRDDSTACIRVIERLSLPCSTTSVTISGIPDLEKQNNPKPDPNQKPGFRIDGKIIYDVILGLSDGLTVPFALTAGLASVGTTRIVILGGLAELVAGAISMGLGGFIGAKSEAETWQRDSRRCDDLIQNEPVEVRALLETHFLTYHLGASSTPMLVDGLLANQSALKEFLMTHHFGAERPSTARPYISALTLGISYFLGGFLALIPYFCVQPHHVDTALWWSIGIMSIVMLMFGYAKTCIVRGWRGHANIKAGTKGAMQMLIVGALAVGAAVGLVRAIESGQGFGV